MEGKESNATTNRFKNQIQKTKMSSKKEDKNKNSKEGKIKIIFMPKLKFVNAIIDCKEKVWVG